MAVYRIGDMLRMKREALGITREKLCEMSEEICSPQTLYRMECGKVKVKQEVYRKLMECMGELSERNYASILVSKYQDLNLKKEIQVHLVHREYEKAEKKIEELKKNVDTEYIRNKQFLLEMNSKIAYYNQQISIEEFLEHLWKALRYTIPSLDKIKFDQWPYNCEEFNILISIVYVYERMKKREKEEKLLLQLKKSMEKKYMEEDYYVSRKIYCLESLSQLMSIQQQHKASIEYCKEGIEKLRMQRLISSIDDLFYDMVWNKEKMIKKEMIKEKERDSCKRNLIQAYYISIARKEDYHSERIKQLCYKLYQEEFKFYL